MEVSERYAGREEIDNFREIFTLPGVLQLVTGKKKLAKADRFLEHEKDRLEGYFVEKGRKAAEGLIDYGTGFLGKNIGKRVKGRIYDSVAEVFVDQITQDYLRGYSRVDFTPVKYASKELTDKNGKKLLGKFKGRKAYFAEDVEKALGEHYEPLRQKVGMTKEQFDWAAKEYIKSHENSEYAVQKYILRKGMSEDEHGKFESYHMKSLYKLSRTGFSGANEIYKVGMAINNARMDEFGEKTRKYLKEDIMFSSQN